MGEMMSQLNEGAAVDTDQEQLVETIFRNGTITTAGILLSFSLGFVAHWAANPLPWEIVDFPTILILLSGILWQAHALHLLLKPHSVRRNIYDRAVHSFFRGVVAVAVGVFLAVLIDFFQIAKLPLL